MPALTTQTLETILNIFNFKHRDLFIESGTYEAETPINVCDMFDRIYTVEISTELYLEAMKTCEKYLNIHCFNYESFIMFKKILPVINTPAVFWLDGHWSKGKTGKGEIEIPLLQELETISALFQPCAIILIDDARLFGHGLDTCDIDWSHITIISILQHVDNKRIGKLMRYNSNIVGIELTNKIDNLT